MFLDLLVTLLIILFVLLALLARTARKKALRIGDSINLSARLTKVGFATYVIYILSLISGAAVVFIWPDSLLSQWLRQIGLIRYFAVMFVLAWFVQVGLAAMGYDSMDRVEK